MPNVRWALTVFVLALVPTYCAHAAWTWTRLEYPGAHWTYAQGVSGDNIVGSCSGNGGIHGYLYDGALWTQLDFPGAYNTYADGVWGDYVVGYYTVHGSTAEAGFLHDASTGAWKSLAYPGAMQTRAQGIYENRVVGYYVDSNYRYHGFLYDGASWKTLDCPRASYWGGTCAWGVWGDKVVGAYDNGLFHGCVYDGKTWTTIDIPGAYGTGLGSISGDNLLGHSQPAINAPGRNFLLSGSTLTWLDWPGAYGMFASGISGNRIVGTCLDADSGQNYGFVLTVPEPATLALVALAALAALRRRRA